MNSLYSRDDERKIRVQRLIRDWQKSALITDAQRDRMLADVQVNFRRTNLFMRAVLFVFSYLIVNAAAGLMIAVFNPNARATSFLALASALVCFAAAQFIVTTYRLYRFGIEEAAAVASASFLAFAGASIVHNRFETEYAFIAATIGAVAVFRRFSFVYAGVAAIIFATCVIFDLEQSDTFRRLFSLILLLTIFFFSRERRQDHDWDFPGDTYAIFEAVAWAGMYLIANLKISSWVSLPDDLKQVYWVSYALVWILPTAGLAFAIVDRHRWMLDVNVVLAIVTLATNKAYLGLPQKPWDPMVFGVMLIAVSLGTRRWLAKGLNGSRSGFVPHRLLDSEKAALAIAGRATVLAPGAPPASPHVHQVGDQAASGQEPPPSSLGGGRSGGAGASGSF